MKRYFKNPAYEEEIPWLSTEQQPELTEFELIQARERLYDWGQREYVPGRFVQFLGRVGKVAEKRMTEKPRVSRYYFINPNDRKGRWR